MAAITPVWEYRSRFELLGLPLIHVRFGGSLGGRIEDRLKRSMKPLKAWFAVTDTFAIGGFFAYGEDVGKVMVVNALPFFSVLFGPKDADTAGPQAASMRDSILAQTQETYAQTEGQILRTLVKSPEGRLEATRWAVASDKSVVARALYEDMMTDLRPKLSKIATAVTILYPWDGSTGFPQATCDGLYRENYASLPNKALVRIDGSYHFIMLDQPGVFASQVDQFLR